MNRPFLFLSGEFRVTMPLVFSNEQWSHSMTARKLVLNEDGTFRRDNVYTERLTGVIYFADVENEEIRRHNLKFLINNKVPCFPNPKQLLLLDDRHRLMEVCVNKGLVGHDVCFLTHFPGIEVPLEYPFVIKEGNQHRGLGKHLVTSQEEIPEWTGVATLEPFFQGVSARALVLGENIWCLRYDNDSSWIKNSPGCEVSIWTDAPVALKEHARKIQREFELEVCGIDYIVESDGKIRFLEYNMFPGLDVDD